jgi:hypothetical protein
LRDQRAPGCFVAGRGHVSVEGGLLARVSFEADYDRPVGSGGLADQIAEYTRRFAGAMQLTHDNVPCGWIGPKRS